MSGRQSLDWTVTPAIASDFQRTYLSGFVRAGEWWRGPCPIHKGTNPSFAFHSESGVAVCHSECGGKKWSLFQLYVDLNGGTLAEARRTIIGEPAAPVEPREVMAYDYRDENDVTLYQNVRFEPGWNGRAKDFKARRKLKDGTIVMNVEGVRRVLYRLSRVLRAEEVYIVEGEKDVLSLEQWKLTATTNVFGAGVWAQSYTDSLKGRHCIILPDNDPPGEKHAAKVSAALEGYAASITVVRLPDLPEKGDVTDWIARGGTLDGLLGLVAAARAVVEAPKQEKFDWKGLGREFSMEQNGLVTYIARHDGEKKKVWISSPIEVLALTRGIDGASWGKLVEFRSLDHVENRVVLQQKLLLGDGKEAIEFLADRGFRMSRGKVAQDALRDFLFQAEPEKKIYCTPRVGWQGRSFVLPDKTYAVPGEKEIIFDPASGLEHKYNVAGTLDEWRETLGRPCTGNSLLVFAVAAAFAAVLLRRAGIQGAGFHYLATSSAGKTTAIHVAGSVWGGAREGSYMDSWRATANGIEAKGTAHNDALLSLDEIGELTEKDAYSTIYMLANGGGKSRMTRGLGARQNASFCTLVLSTGEKTIADIIEKAGHTIRGGQEARMIQVRADAVYINDKPSAFQDTRGMLGADFSTMLVAASRQSYGTPIRAFLAALTANWDQWISLFDVTRKQFRGEAVAPGSAPEVFRTADTFATVAAAGVLASEMGITGWTRQESTQAATWVWRRWLDDRGGSGAMDTKRGLDLIMSFLLRSAARFESLGGTREGRAAAAVIQDLAGYVESIDGGTRYLLFDFVLPEILRGYDITGVLREAKATGFLQVIADGRFTIQRRIPDRNRPRFYVFVLFDSEAAAGAPLLALARVNQRDEETLRI